MELKTIGMAGTLESSDISITIQPNDLERIEIDLQSSVKKQFGNQILQVIKETLQKLDVKSASVRAIDKGALDCVIKARTEAAAYRSAKKKEYDWKE